MNKKQIKSIVNYLYFNNPPFSKTYSTTRIGTRIRGYDFILEVSKLLDVLSYFIIEKKLEKFCISILEDIKHGKI